MLADSVVVITGASSGMGKEIAFRYAERGCKIVIAARKINDLEKVSDACPDLRPIIRCGWANLNNLTNEMVCL
jgi:NADP-dependent 3-hydroxy acid dehydrogenase YdfG